MESNENFYDLYGSQDDYDEPVDQNNYDAANQDYYHGEGAPQEYGKFYYIIIKNFHSFYQYYISIVKQPSLLFLKWVDLIM